MTNYELIARKAGWFPTRESHVMFKDADSSVVTRYLVAGETYSEETDSLMSLPQRHADNWAHACKLDGLAP